MWIRLEQSLPHVQVILVRACFESLNCVLFQNTAAKLRTGNLKLLRSFTIVSNLMSYFIFIISVGYYFSKPSFISNRIHSIFIRIYNSISRRMFFPSLTTSKIALLAYWHKILLTHPFHFVVLPPVWIADQLSILRL